jgi:hypothetical protein
MGSIGVSALIERLRVDLSELADLETSPLSDVELLDALRLMHPLVNQAQAVQTRLIGAVHHRGAVTADGAVSTQAWLRGRLHLGNAAAQIRVAGALDTLPCVADAYQRGELSFDHVEAIATVARDIDPTILAAGADKLLTEQATTLAPAPLRRAANRIRDYFDPDAATRRARRHFSDRWLSVSRTFAGTVSIQGVLDPEGGELFLATLAALTPPAALTDPRTPGARRADALVQMCRLVADSAPQAGGEKPHVTVTVDWNTLRDELSTSAITGNGRWPGATVGNGVPIHPATARRLACDAAIIPALLGSAGEPLDIGRATRVIPSALRRALVLRDGGCRFPLCDRPPSWTDSHHLQPWAQGGTTSLKNLVLLCRAHHTAVHEGGWRIALDPVTATVTVHHPDGRPHDEVSRPHAHAP